MSRGRIRKRLFDRLGVRLAILLAMALLPLLLIAMLQSLSMLREAHARSEAALMGETMRAVAGETRLIQQAQSEARLIAETIVPALDNTATCRAYMRKVAKADPHLSLAAFIPLSGRMECSSTGTVYDFSGNPLFERIAETDAPSFIVNPAGPVSHTSILGISYPVRDAQGVRVGLISLSLPHKELAAAEDGEGPEEEEPLVILTFDGDGNILTSSEGMETAKDRLPVDRALKALAGTRSAAFTAVSNLGRKRVYSVVELVPDQLYALGSWPARDVVAFGPFSQIPPLLFPSLMWIASLFVAYFATQKLVIGHIKRLSRALTSFASGSRHVTELDFADAPREIRDLAESFERMTGTILHDEAKLEDEIHHKEVLLREVHHRVKNNLQLIASIINMQQRKARTPEARGLMRNLQERVISLATIHRGLYQTSGLTDIRANELIPEIVREITRIATGPGRRIAVDSHVDDIHLTPDQAVPLALLLTEAMTNAMKYASADSGPPQLAIAIRATGPTAAQLSVSNSMATHAPETSAEETGEGTGLGTQLLQAFVQQLGGKLAIAQVPGEYLLTVDFALRPLAEAEERRSAPEEPSEEG
ncbi:MAG: sensor histidine kinase [Paenirhodobacter sp.]|uniref:sensor histidine kinase n=1 Tax=Paenirhodobacter sp. TaxID=1965326 RepID=UPI003D13019C